MNKELGFEVKNAIVELMASSKMGQNAVARKFGISQAHMSSLMNEKFEQISKEKLTELANALNVSSEKKWKTLETKQLTIIHNVCREVKNNSLLGAIIAETGQGKTTALEFFEKQNANTYYVLCNVLMNQAIFLREIAKSMAINATGSKTDLLTRITDKLNSTQQPLLILDDFGKVSDKIYQMLQLIYDMTKDAAGIIIAGTPYLFEYIKKRKDANKFCFPELHSRVQFWKQIGAIDATSITQIAQMYDINDASVIKLLRIQVKNYRNLQAWIMHAKKNAKGEEISLDIMTSVINN